MSSKPKIIIITGPTASGKSALAIKLAKVFNGEIISADSRQIYRKMDLGTGKVARDKKSSTEFFLSEGIVHHAVDIVHPNEDFNVSDFKKYALEKIQEIIQRKKLPIVCGGTGFWIKALVDNLDFPQVKPDILLRNKLNHKTAEELFTQLQKIDVERAASIDPQNKVRLIRALEICRVLGKVPKPETRKTGCEQFDFLQIALETDKEILCEKIQKRLNERFDQGMIAEVKNLHNPPTGRGISWERLEGFGLEYRRIAQFLQEKISKDEMQEKLYFDIIHYAKRQITWLKKDSRLVWIKNSNQAEKLVSNFLKK